MITNADITVFNSRWDSVKGENVVRATVIRGVHWHSQNKVSVTNEGLKNARVVKIRIPIDAQVEDGRVYLPPDEYEAADAPEDYWTVKNGDAILRGVFTSAADLKSVKSEKTTVIDWRNNSYGRNQHLYAEGG